MEPVPQVINSSQNIPTQSPAWKRKSPLIFLGAVILVIIVELIWGFQTFYQAKKSNPLENNPAIIEDVSPQLIVQTPKTSFKPGEVVPVTIKVVTAGSLSDSADVILRYDPTVLEASGSSFIVPGRIYQEYPVADFDNQNGTIQLSGTTPSGSSGFSGIGSLATFNFKAKSAGKTTVALDFQPGSTAESNIVLSGSPKDILTKVVNADILITDSPVATDNSKQSQSCSGFFQYCQIGENAGKQFCQSGKVVNNQCTFDAEQTVGCSECQLQ